MPPVARPRALVVLPRGATRAAVARVLEGRGFDAVQAGDPFDAMARFSEAPADLVVASLEGWTRRDLAFIAAVRARAPAARIVVLLPVHRRALAAPALKAGANAYLNEPVDLDEIAAVAGRPAAAAAGTGPDDPRALPTLGAQVAHALGNPLQVVSLLLDAAGPASAAELRAAVRPEVARMREALEILKTLERLAPPVRQPGDVAALVEERVEALRQRGVLAPPDAPQGGAGGRSSVRALVDAEQVSMAVEAILRGLAARSEVRPAPGRARARRTDRGLEIRARVRGVRWPASTWEADLGAVLAVDERTRAPLPGLALPAAVARGHGGALLRRETEAGTVLVLRLPTP